MNNATATRTHKTMFLTRTRTITWIVVSFMYVPFLGLTHIGYDNPGVVHYALAAMLPTLGLIILAWSFSDVDKSHDVAKTTNASETQQIKDIAEYLESRGFTVRTRTPRLHTLVIEARNNRSDTTIYIGKESFSRGHDKFYLSLFDENRVLNFTSKSITAVQSKLINGLRRNAS